MEPPPSPTARAVADDQYAANATRPQVCHIMMETFARDRERRQPCDVGVMKIGVPTSRSETAPNEVCRCPLGGGQRPAPR